MKKYLCFIFLLTFVISNVNSQDEVPNSVSHFDIDAFSDSRLSECYNSQDKIIISIKLDELSVSEEQISHFKETIFFVDFNDIILFSFSGEECVFDVETSSYLFVLPDLLFLDCSLNEMNYLYVYDEGTYTHRIEENELLAIPICCDEKLIKSNSELDKRIVSREHMDQGTFSYEVLSASGQKIISFKTEFLKLENISEFLKSYNLPNGLYFVIRSDQNNKMFREVYKLFL